MNIHLKSCYKKSEDIIEKEIEGELIIIPLSSGVGDLESDMFSLNRTGAIVWNCLDGKTPLSDLINDIAKVFNTTYDHIENDVIEIIKDLVEKGLVVEGQIK